ncbi:MAG TPA: ABC transporter ATP-binding protein [Candidatus Aminicenantes bacterium]|nr:ABC transporter ATP-binding protein [Candidatus Aminicenantes bacterium]
METEKPGVDSNHPAAIRISHVSKKIAKKQVLDDVVIAAPRGKTLAVCGPNGAGKTTLIRILLGLLKPDTGSVQMAALPQNCSFQFHSPCLFPDLTLQQNCRFFLSSKNRSLKDKNLVELMKEFNLEGARSGRVGTFSRGMQQKADLIRALLEEPEILFLDEPTSHLDPLGKVSVRKILQRRVKSGMTLLMTSHLLGEVEKLADHVCILKDGKVIWNGEPRKDPQGRDLESRFVELVTASQGRLE